MPEYYFRGSYKGQSKARRYARELQILRILNENNPKWTSQRFVADKLKINIVNARNLLNLYTEQALAKIDKTKMGKYKISIYKLTDHGRYELQQLEMKFAGELV